MDDRRYLLVAPAQNLKLLARQGDARSGMSTLYKRGTSFPGLSVVLNTPHSPVIGFQILESELNGANIEPRPYFGNYLSTPIPRELLRIPAPLATLLKGEDLSEGYFLSLGFRKGWLGIEVRLTHRGKRIMNLEVLPQTGTKLRRVQLTCVCGWEPYSEWCYYEDDVSLAPQPEIGTSPLVFGEVDLTEAIASWLSMDALAKAFLGPQIASYVNRTALWFESQENTFGSQLYMGEERTAMDLTGEPIGDVVKVWAKTPAGAEVRARKE